jgi:protein TonB
MSLVDPTRDEPRVSVRRTSRGTVVVSLALHVVVLTAVVVVPLFGRVTLPDTNTRSMPSFVHAVTAPPIPPPATSPAPARTASAVAAPASATQTHAAAPVEAPDQLPTGEPPTYIPGALTPGSHGGVPHGGLDGGLPGAPPLAAPPPPPARVTTPLRVGGEIRPPRKLQHVAPVYPSIALQAKVGGTVVLEATIGRTGVVTDVRVLRSVPLLDAAAVAAVQQWRYEPTRLNGEPVAVLLTVTVRFAP